jgi:spore germination cell wall hydrolase CwlJ-like protein
MCINYQRGITFTLSVNSSHKYYYVQLATGASQWETPSATSPTAESASDNSKEAASPHNMPREAQESDSKDQRRG